MATKKGGKKSGGGKKSAAKKGAAKKSSGKLSATKLPLTNGLPPIIVGGGGSILIYSDQRLVEPNLGEAPPKAGYPYVLIYPDRTKDPVHVTHKRNNIPVRFHRHALTKATDTVAIETD